MNRTAILLLALGLAACATLRGSVDTGSVYREGLAALGRHDFAAATLQLQHASGSEAREIADRSTVLLAVAALDPANPSRRMDAADGLAERLANADPVATFEQVVGATLERMADETQVLRNGMIAAQSQRDSAFRVIDRVRAQTDSLTAERDAARRKNAQLELASAELTMELEKKTQEIERIRRAIRR